MLNLKHLYYFWIFSHHLSKKDAAKILKITSPALSNQLKSLDEYMGTPLTERKNNRVVITEAGERVLFYANQMFSLYEDLNMRVLVSEAAAESTFRVGICHFLGAQFSFDLITLIFNSSFSTSQKVHVTFGGSSELLDGIKKDPFDLILGSFTLLDDARETKWSSQTLTFPVRLFALPGITEGVSSKGVRLALNDLSKMIELANTKGLALALPCQPSNLREETEKFFLNSRVFPSRTVECNSSSGIIQLIERGHAIGFFPTPCLLDFKSADSLLVLGPPGGYWLHKVSAIIKKGKGRSMSEISHLADIFSPSPKKK